MAAVATLFVICAQLMLLFLGSLAWLAYNVLKEQGMSVEQSAAILSFSIFILLVSAALTLRSAFRDMHGTMDYELRKKPSLSHAVNSIADSFMDGFFAEPTTQVDK